MKIALTIPDCTDIDSDMGDTILDVLDQVVLDPSAAASSGHISAQVIIPAPDYRTPEEIAYDEGIERSWRTGWDSTVTV